MAISPSDLDGFYIIIDTINNMINEYGAAVVPEYIRQELKKVFNDFFKDYKCQWVDISNNTDKEFFGVYIYRNYNVGCFFVDDLDELYESDEYMIDIDSKLFTIGLAVPEIVSLIIYDMYKILSREATLQICASIDAITAGRRVDMIRSDKVPTYAGIQHLINFCACDYLYRNYSIFSRNSDELIRIPDLLEAYVLKNTFMDATEKLFKSVNTPTRVLPNPNIIMNWIISVLCRFNEFTTEHIFSVLDDYISTSGSKYIVKKCKIIAKQFIERHVRAINKAGLREASLFNGIRKNGLRTLENDLFEYEMRVKNIDDENSAIFLMRQINSRMAIIQDYMEEEKISDAERRRWMILYDRYDRLRVKMTTKPIYSRKMYGLFTDYNALCQPGAENLMTMNTMY